VLSNNIARGTTGNIFSDLTGIISSNPTSTTSPSSHQARNNRLNAVPSNQENYHNTNSNNNSITQLSSPLSTGPPSIQSHSPTTTTTQTEISQQCQPKSRLLINHKNHHDDDFSKHDSREINLHQTKEIEQTSPSQQNHISSNGMTSEDKFENLYGNSNGMITIVTINDNNVTGGNANSIA
jgi:SLT domain-containing protein